MVYLNAKGNGNGVGGGVRDEAIVHIAYLLFTLSVGF